MAKKSSLWNSAPMKIALGVTGSISAYKAFDLARDFVKSGHRVRVILTKGALAFIKPETFIYLGCEAVYQPDDDFGELSHRDPKLEGSVLHVALAKWADRMIIAPLSSNTLATFCQGRATDLLSSLFLAWRKDKPLVVFPAMNTEMLSHPFVQENLKKLNGLPFVFIAGTKSGLLACGDEGAGKLADLAVIKAIGLTWSLPSANSKKILISTGATVAPLDEVRYLTNASTGKTAIPFIEAMLLAGNKVTVIAGHYATEELNNYEQHLDYEVIRIKTTGDMYEKVLENFTEADLYISCAAIGDIEFEVSTGKLKKSQMESSLKIKRAPDVLAAVLKVKKPHQKVIGFAAESELSDEVLIEKFKRKPVDLLVGTKVSNGLISNEGESLGFKADQAHYRFVTCIDNINMSAEKLLTKREMANATFPLIWENNAALH